MRDGPLLSRPRPRADRRLPRAPGRAVRAGRRRDLRRDRQADPHRDRARGRRPGQRRAGDGPRDRTRSAIRPRTAPSRRSRTCGSTPGSGTPRETSHDSSTVAAEYDTTSSTPPHRRTRDARPRAVGRDRPRHRRTPRPMSCTSAIGPTVPSNVPSVSFAAESINEFGDLVTLAPGPRELTTVSVLMSTQACETGTGATCVTTPGATFDHPLTMTLYNVAGTPAAPTVGSVIATLTHTFTIPFRPSADPVNCTGPNAGRWFDGTTCSTGIAVVVDFVFPAGTILPDTLIWGIAYNTATAGRAPIGTPGPYDSLNVGALTVNPTVGTDVDEDMAFIADFPSGAFVSDLGWTANRPMARIATQVPPTVPCQAANPIAGYRLVASDGGVFSFGNQQFCGSTGAMHLNQPIVGISTTVDGGGYWLVAADGGIFTFGDAALPRLDRRACASTSPSSAWPPTPTGNGYWLVAADGGIFTFGDAALLRLHRRHARSTSPSSAWPRRRPATATGSSPPTAASSPSATPRFLGSTGAMHAQPAHRRHGRDADRQRLLARRRRRRHLHLRRRRLPRLHRRDARSTSPSSAWPRRRPATATGSSPPTAASSPSATPLPRLHRRDAPQPTHRRHGLRHRPAARDRGEREPRTCPDHGSHVAGCHRRRKCPRQHGRVRLRRGIVTGLSRRGRLAGVFPGQRGEHA